tara:strand:- start:7074 stop:7604 length:531 start_codon:yes stop_codon:yes gene_type:complete
MASIILTLLFSFHVMAADPIRIVFKMETPDFTHQLTAEEIGSQTLRITLNSNTFFSNSSHVRIGVWKVNSLRISDFINSVNAMNSQKPEITIDRRGHETQYWISGKKLHLDSEESKAYSELLKAFLMADNAELEEGFEFDTTTKKITRSKKTTEPKYTCDKKTKQCRFENTARIAF